VVFLDPGAKAVLVLKFHIALHASYVALPTSTSKRPPKSRHPIAIKISPCRSPPLTKLKIHPKFSPSFQCCILISHPTTLPSLPNAQLCIYPTFSWKRTSEHCLGTII